MRLLLNHIYEYRKGVRGLFMLTATGSDILPMRDRLAREGIDYFIQQVSPTKANLFFGRSAWVDMARRIVTRPLGVLSPEEDFILGTLLGYDPEHQCRRYLERRGRRDRAADWSSADWQGVAAAV